MRKLIAACLVITAFAVVPSMASAKPVLTSPTGTVAPTTTKIIGTLAPGTESKLVTSIGTLSCNTATLTGELTKNSTAEGTEGTITSAVFGNTSGGTLAGQAEPECTGSGFFLGRGAFVTATPPFCLEATEAADTIKVRGGKCGSAAAIVFHLTVTNPFGAGFPHVNCTYTRSSLSPISGTLNTHPTQAGGAFTEQEFTKTAESGGECPASGKLTMTVVLETDPAGAPVYISS